MTRSAGRPRLARAAGRRKRGQALVIFALGSVALVGLVGLAVDGGRSYVDKRTLQSAADAAADAGARMLSVNAITASTYSDADISTAVANIVPGSVGGGDKAGNQPTNAYYTDSAANRLPSGSPCKVGSCGTIPSGAVGVEVGASDKHSTYFMRLVGTSNATESATAVSMFTIIQQFDFNNPAFAPYAAWNTLCTAGFPHINIGDSIVFRSNSWKDSAACGNSGITSNNFKGWFHDPSETIFNQGDTVTAKGGNAIGQEPIPQIQQSYASGKPFVIPIVDSASGNGSNITFHIAGFVAILPNQSCWANSGTCSPSTDWTATVMAWSPTYTGFCNAPCGPISSFEPAAVYLYK
jgi:Flp pilus assembly protein TadG